MQVSYMRILIMSQNKNLSQPHVHSYYDDSAYSYAEYPVLESITKADACIIGGGITGLSTALYRC